MSFAAICALGDQANELLRLGRFAEAEAAYTNVLVKHREDGALDSFILAKVTLGWLLAKVRSGAVQEAHGIWIQSLEDQTIPGMGIHFLETGQTSTHDLITYYFVSAYLHSMTPDPAQALRGVEDMMGRILGYASEKDPSLFPMALRNYHAHLLEIFDGRVPEAAWSSLRAWAARHGAPLATGHPNFPAPSKWVIDWGRPGDQATVFTPGGDVEQAPIGPAGRVQIGAEISANGAKRIYRMLCNLAGSDGDVDPKERRVLDSVVQQFGLAPAEAQALEREGVAGKGLRVGKQPAERQFLLETMIEVAAADGHLAPQELKRLEAFAKLVGLPRDGLVHRLRMKGLMA